MTQEEQRVEGHEAVRRAIKVIREASEVASDCVFHQPSALLVLASSVENQLRKPEFEFNSSLAKKRERNTV